MFIYSRAWYMVSQVYTVAQNYDKTCTAMLTPMEWTPLFKQCDLIHKFLYNPS